MDPRPASARRTRSGAVRALLLTSVLVAAACGGSGGRPGVSAPGSSTPAGTASEASASASDVLPLDGGPDWLAADDRWLYVKLDSGAVVRVDPATARAVGTTTIGGSVCQGIGAGLGAVWACKDSAVVRIDPERDQVVATLPVAKAPEQGHLVTSHGRVWIIAEDGRSLVGVDPATDQADPPIPLPIRATELAGDERHVWAASAVERAVVRVDPVTKAVDGQVSDVGSVVSMASDGTTLFVATPDQVVTVDAVALVPTGTVAVTPGASGSLSLTALALWVHTDDQLVRVPVGAAAGAPVAIAPKAASGGDVLAAFGFVWVSANDDDVVVRVPVR